ncbi:hypothetical protein PRK78_005979 [Emydomyces testavorans]|uniref:RRM domain-containing protein n=1 Tax=Emydomyces testavorans TaxID=2070801 RepID=A0AAF0IL74_9EURO|nr:hypothetical protein PRK78_005979 [Emydomyces testavorans]
MLKPFRVKDLLDPVLDGQPRTPLADTGNGESTNQAVLNTVHIQDSMGGSRRLSILRPGGTYDGVVEISRSEYDDTISSCPEAKLSYIDDDDGETITVGSSFELAQRLEEPPAYLSTLPATRPFDQPGGSPMHTFDINRSSSAINTWRTFEERTSSQAKMSQPSTSSPLKISGNAADDSVSPPVPSPTPELNFGRNANDPFERWFEACNPPKLTNGNMQRPEVLSEKALPQEATRPEIVLASTASTDSLTEEGRKQAQAAGAKLREARNIWSKSPSPFLTPVTAQNFWSSYDQSRLNRNGKNMTEREPKSQESPIVGQPRSLLAAFEAELSHLVEANTPPEKTLTAPVAPEPLVSSSPEPQPQPPTWEQKPETQVVHKAAEVVGQALHALLGSVGQVTSELRSRLPEVERRLANAQQQVPAQIEASMQNFAQVTQDATASMRAVTARARQAEMLVTDHAEKLCAEVGDMAKTLLSSLDTKFSADNRTNESGSQILQPATALDSSLTQGQDSAHVSPQPNPGLIIPSDAQLIEPGIEPHLRNSTAPDRASTAHKALFIGGLNPTTTEDTIRKVLMDHGFLGWVKLSMDTATGKHAGFGYIHFPSTHAATGALNALTNSIIDGQRINLEYSHRGPIDDTHNMLSAGISQTKQSSSESLEVSNVCFPSAQQNTSCRQPEIPNRTGSQLFRTSRPNVTFDVSSDSDSLSTTIPLAKSPDALSFDENNHITAHEEINSQNDSKGASGYPNGRRSADDHFTSQRSEKKRSDLTSVHAPTLLDAEDADKDFSARYPPLPTLFPHPMPSRYIRKGLVSARPLERPVSTQCTQVSNALQPEAGSRQLASAQNRSAIFPRERNSLPPLIPDKVPGAWPREQYDNARDNPMRRGNATGHIPSAAEHRRRYLRRPNSFALNQDSSTSLRGLRRSESERLHTQTPMSFFESAPPMQRPYNPPGSFPFEPHVNRPMRTGGRTSSQWWPTPSNEREISDCVANLVSLGYSSSENRGTSRLRVYAEAANGNLNDAIEMIEEEKKAYEQWSAHT